MLFCRANLATSLIFLMESSSSKFRSATPLRGVDAMVSFVWRSAGAAVGAGEGRYRCIRPLRAACSGSALGVTAFFLRGAQRFSARKRAVTEQ